MQIQALTANKYKKTLPNRDANINKTLKGVLINNHNASNTLSFDDIHDSLLIVDAPEYTPVSETQESSFNINKAIKPLLIGTMLLAGGCFGISKILNKSSQYLLGVKNCEQLPDLAINNNIKEETHFAIYRMIRDPNFKNILGATAVFTMSGITIACKNFVDGAKEIWLKKQSADVEKNLQENLIAVETNSFSGKLQVVNNMLSKNVEYFDRVLNNKSVFSDFISFKGKKEDGSKKEQNKNIKYVLFTIGVLASSIALGKFTYSNIKKAVNNSQKYANNITERTINAINEMGEKADSNDLSKVKQLLNSICAKPEFVREIGQKFNLSEEEIKTIIKTVEETKKTTFADAPTALGGIPQKIQYYCYMDENRGHLYNWIINPENKYTKYIFGAFTLSSAVGYLFKQTMDAIKDATVIKENAKTELDLRKRLVDVEIKNFKSKKESAIQPLIDNFNKELNSGKKTKEELKQLADNILTETKNGPPYVYT